MKFKHGTRRRALEYEKDWVGRWKDDNTFEKSVENRRADNAYVFYDGPPFITGVPHHGTLLSSIVKDAVPRYWTMKGKRVERRWGWDCHGLPAENYVEKQLGITDRRQIVTDKSQPAPLDKDGNELPTISLETYINKARESMVASSETWEGVIDRIGRWVDFKGAYRTMDKDFMESVWWAFKKLYDGGKIYEGEKVLMYDTKFATPVSKAEVTMDNDAYQTVTDPSVYVKFKLKNDLAKSELPRVLFVCQANLGRSQIARGFYNKYTNTDSADSAGVFVDTKFYPGALSLDEVTNERGKPLGSVVLMQEKDIDIAFAKRTQLTPDMVEKYDIVVDLMKDDEERPEWFLSKHVEHWNIDDIGVGQADIRKTRDTIETKVRELANRYAAIDTKSVSLLAWTTTPWTLPANLMLAVNPEMVYCEVLVGDEKLIIAKDALERVLKDEKNQPLKYEVLREFPGSELVGKSYEPLETGSTWPENDKIHKIYAADFVSNESGTGIVHVAPAYGEDDFELAKSYGIAPFHVIDDNGYYTDTNYKGLEVWDNNKFIAKDLKEKGIVWKIEYIRHEYPFNPRSKQRIMYRAIPSWFFDIQGSKPLMLEQNENINWFPPHLKHGRFAKNIEQAPDWNLSRDRFWATAMPVWKGDKGTVKVIGSYAELKELSGVELEDYHRPWVDDIEFDLPYVANQDDDVQIEKLDVFDENGNLTGEVKDRRLIHHDGDWHKAVHIWIINDKDQILLQRRVAWKDSNPNMLDISSAGHVIAGDSSLSAAIRELQEELGLKIKPEDLQFVKRIKKQSKYTPTFINNEFDDMFILKTEKTVSEMKIQKEEVAEVFFVSFEKFREMVEKKDPELLQHTEEFEILFDYFDGKVIPHEELDNEKSGETEHFTRIDKVLDCWFESGSMPFAQLHYPFENQEKFEQNYPAEFITEYVPQVRAWFYYVHSINTNLAELGAFGEDSNKIHKNAFKNVIVTGTLAGNDGRKMSKSFGNFTDPNVLMDKFSADSLRFLLLSSPLLNSEDFALHDKDVGDVARKLGMVWNMYDFFTMYAEVDGWEYDGNLVDPLDSLKNPLDIWIVSRVHQLVAEVETYMDEYNIPDALSLVLPFLDDASNWYVRRSRRRFWKSEDDGDKNDAYKTLHHVLVRLSYLLAPFTPFLAEELYHNLTGDSESIHLKNWLPAGNINEKVVADMARTRELITNGLAQRMRKDENQDAIKVRQPLAFASYAGNKLDEVYEQIMQEELNVKEIRWIENLDEHLAKYDEVEGKIDAETWIEVSKVLTPELRREGMMREVIRYIQNARKDAGLNVDDRIILDLTTDDDDLKTAIGEFSETIKSETLTENFAPANQYEVSVKVEGRELNIRLAKS